MKYKILKPTADGEIGENAVIDWKHPKRKIIKAHIYLYYEIESEVIQAYPIFIFSRSLCDELKESGITGIDYIPLEISKAPQYDELSKNKELPSLECIEPCGAEGIDDVIYHNETAFKVSERFIELAKKHSLFGCEITNLDLNE